MIVFNTIRRGFCRKSDEMTSKVFLRGEKCAIIKIMRVPWRNFFRRLGPGLVTGASDDDPSGIVTYAQAGAGFSFSVLWTSLFSLPFMLVAQEMSARLAMITGRGLVRNMRLRLPRAWTLALVVLLLVANTINIGADLGMMASSAQLFLPLPFPVLLILFALVSVAFQVFLPYRVYARYLKWLTLSLFAYVAVGLMLRVDARAALMATIVPSWQWRKEYVLILVALFGTTLSPYLLFWQADQEVEEEIQSGRVSNGMGRKRPRMSKRDIRWMRYDVTAGMIFSNVVAWFIMFVAAVLLSQNGGVSITGADHAARMLIPIAGAYAGWLFALGVIGAGLLAVPILSDTAAYACIEMINVDSGLSKTWKQARGFYGIILLLTLIGLLMNFIGIDPIRALIYAAVANGIVAPPILGTLLFLCNDPRLLGKWTNRLWSNALGYAIVLIMTALPLVWLWTAI